MVPCRAQSMVMLTQVELFHSPSALRLAARVSALENWRYRRAITPIMIETMAITFTTLGDRVCAPVLLPTHTAAPAERLSLDAKCNQSIVTAISARSKARAAR